MHFLDGVSFPHGVCVWASRCAVMNLWSTEYLESRQIARRWELAALRASVDGRFSFTALERSYSQRVMCGREQRELPEWPKLRLCQIRRIRSRCRM
jgi:hypothetical protein